MFIPDMRLIDADSKHPLRRLTEGEAADVTVGPACSQRILRDAHIDRRHLECECRRRFCVVQGVKSYFLRANPDQPADCPYPCTLKAREREAAADMSNGFRGLRKSPEFTLGPILGAVAEPTCRRDGERTDAARKSATAQKYRGMHETLHRILAELGHHEFDPVKVVPDHRGWAVFWETIQRWLAIHRYRGTAFSDLAWMPHPDFRGGFVGLNRRLHSDWRLPELVPEGWIFGITESLPDSELELHGLNSFQRAAMLRQGREPFSYRLPCDKQKRAVVGRSGPYLVFGVCTRSETQPTDRTKPVLRRLYCQSVVSDNWPLPVESDYERRTALLLRRLGLPFRKPVFASDDGLRPDFVLPKHRIFIEVQGMDDDQYREHKAEMHREVVRRYPRWSLLTWNPNDGEELEVFEKLLIHSVGKITSI